MGPDSAKQRFAKRCPRHRVRDTKGGTAGLPTYIQLRRDNCSGVKTAQRGAFALNASLQEAGRTRTSRPGGSMHRRLTTLQRGFNERIGWKRLGIALSLLVIAVAITTLVRMLKGVDIGVILLALAEKP